MQIPRLSPADHTPPWGASRSLRMLGRTGMRPRNCRQRRRRDTSAYRGAARRLSRKGAEYEIRVDWYMGAIAIAPP
jgi:hypothetical protein